MNYLQLCQSLSREASLPGTGPAAVTGQTGESGRLVTWIKDAWVEIQTKRPDWGFLYGGESSIQTVASTKEYAVQVGGNDIVLLPNITCYLAATGLSDQRKLTPVSWADFNGVYTVGEIAEGRPVRFSVKPSGELILHPTPDAVYTIGFDYYSLPVELAANTDVPNIDSRHHMAIVYLALTYYAQFEEDDALMRYAVANYTRRMNRLERDYLPQIVVGAPALA